MVHKTRGIVLRFTRFRETSIIVNVFTEQFGLQSYIVNGVRSSSPRTEMALYQPLTLLDMVVYHKDQGQVTRIKEKHCLHPYHDLPGNLSKSAIAMFLNELLTKTLREEMHLPELFEFIFNALVSLDTLDSGYENFHLLFMIRFAAHLGFGIEYADVLAGGRPLDTRQRADLETLLETGPGWHATLRSPRRPVLDLLIQFFNEHIRNLGEMKSVRVLQEVLH